jgi:hypothetical protein
MSLDSNVAYAKRSTAAAEPRLAGIVGLRANLGERVITAIATGIAVLVVAAIAVLMGMA